MSYRRIWKQRYHRAAHKRITPLGWFMLLFGAALLALTAYAGLTWYAAQRPSATPTPQVEASPVPTLAPTATVSATVAFPATWAATMVQDADGNWWPEDLVAVQAMVEEHYLDWYDHATGPYDELLATLTDAEARRYQAGEILEGWFWLQQQYRDYGKFPERVQVITQRGLTVQGFSPDGLTCRVGDTYLAGQHLVYHPESATWEQVELPGDGWLDGVQYLGVSVKEMHYDTEDGRWKVAASLKWIPRP